MANSNAPKPYKNVRLRESTYARLVAAIESIASGVESGRIADPGLQADAINPATRALTFDQLLNMLLDRRDAHNARAKKSRAKK